MRRALLALGLACLAITLALIAGAYLPSERRPLVLGMITGAASGVPASLACVWWLRRAQRREGRAAAAPTVIAVPPAPSAQPSDGAPQAGCVPAGPLVREARPAAIIGAAD
jgi:hypothetical protein